MIFKRRFFILFLGLFFCGTALAMEYSSKSLRDPFVDNSAPEPPAEKKPAESEGSIQLLQLQGILVGGVKPRAIINGKIVEVGSKLPVGKVEKISKEGVSVLYNNKTYVLHLKERKVNDQKTAGTPSKSAAGASVVHRASSDSVTA